MCSVKVPESDNTESTFQERSEEDWDEYTETGGEYAWYDADDDDEEDVYDEDGHLPHHHHRRTMHTPHQSLYTRPNPLRSASGRLTRCCLIRELSLST